MTALEVSSVVDSILAAFTNGMDVFVRIRGRKRNKHKKVPRMSQEELKLHDSLQNRPKEIKSEYDNSVVKHGKKFQLGDYAAYSRLAHTLFVLNTGLINLINSALAMDTKDPSASRQSLLLLSESAAASTMQALGQLDLRLSIVDLSLNRNDNGQQLVKHTTNQSTPARPAPSPLLQRGGWVRSKSGSSVVSAASAKKWAAHNGGRQRSHSAPVPKPPISAPNVPLKTRESASKSAAQERSCSCQNSPKLLDSREWTATEPQMMFLSKQDSMSSMLLVPADYFDGSNPAREGAAPPPRPPKIPLHARASPKIRVRPVSAATFMTASTKIGEIPEHKWADREISEEDRERLPLPYVIPPPLQPPKKKNRGLRFWKIPERNERVSAY